MVSVCAATIDELKFTRMTNIANNREFSLNIWNLLFGYPN